MVSVLNIYSKRILTFDILRAFCVFWIVCIWHLTNYVMETWWGEVIYNSAICSKITNIVLALFMFISGLFSNSLQVNSYKDIFEFYKKKFFRFYILYVISILTIIYADYSPVLTFFPGGFSQIFLSFFGLATIFNNAPSTLWFMDLLLFFTLITPFIIKFDGIRKKVYIVFIWLIFFLLNRYTDYIDSRIVLYYPYYVLGLNFTPKQIIEIAENIKVIIYLFVCVAILCLIPNNFLCQYLYITFFVFFLIFLARKMENVIYKYSRWVWIVYILSYSSLCVYLFHRQLIKLLLLCHIEIFLTPFIIFPLCYFVQKKYDLLLKK